MRAIILILWPLLAVDALLWWLYDARPFMALMWVSLMIVSPWLLRY